MISWKFIDSLFWFLHLGLGFGIVQKKKKRSFVCLHKCTFPWWRIEHTSYSWARRSESLLPSFYLLLLFLMTESPLKQCTSNLWSHSNTIRTLHRFTIKIAGAHCPAIGWQQCNDYKSISAGRTVSRYFSVSRWTKYHHQWRHKGLLCIYSCINFSYFLFFVFCYLSPSSRGGVHG